MGNIDHTKLTGIKQGEFTPCLICNRGMMHANDLAFYRIRIERALINPAAVRRTAALEMMVGSPMLALVLGPNDDLAKVFGGPHVGLICQGCALSLDSAGGVALLMEKMEERATEAEIARAKSKKIADLDVEHPGWREAKHPNGAPRWSPAGMMLDPDGSRSTFDDVDE